MLSKLAILIGILMLAAAPVACGGNANNAPTKTPVVQSQRGLSVAFAVQAGQRALDRAASGSSARNGTAAPGVNTQETASQRASSLGYSLSNDGLTVTGYGIATAAADSAILELSFSSTSTYPRATTGASDGSTPVITGITEADLQPVIDALVDTGVDRGDIEYIGGSYYDPYYASEGQPSQVQVYATVSVTYGIQ